MTTMTDDVTPEQLRQARLALGKSQTTMARLLKVTFVSYHRWEHGLAKPSAKHRGNLKKLVALAAARTKGGDNGH